MFKNKKLFGDLIIIIITRRKKYIFIRINDNKNIFFIKYLQDNQKRKNNNLTLIWNNFSDGILTEVYHHYNNITNVYHHFISSSNIEIAMKYETF